jgi:hypothetical protein
MDIARSDDDPHATKFSEDNKIFRRTSRIYVQDVYYYYTTREHEVRGPFLSLNEVNKDLKVFLKVTAIEREFDQSLPFKMVS